MLLTRMTLISLLTFSTTWAVSITRAPTLAARASIIPTPTHNAKKGLTNSSPSPFPLNSSVATMSPQFVGCVSPDYFNNISCEGDYSRRRTEDKCISSELTLYAYYIPETKECFCAGSTQYPTPEVLVNDTDTIGDCAYGETSVTYLYSPFLFEQCYGSVTPSPPSEEDPTQPATYDFTPLSIAQCLDICATIPGVETTGIRAFKAASNDAGCSVYQCTCYEGYMQGETPEKCGQNSVWRYFKVSA
nr:uncharacterized protein CI109_003308 [Kwoniella shandongensis]KAA5528408.1 hypothetical protein CI109_003308 [Kwoniella shandongensis]